jgi:TRAP-type C4-dicarboxylate transport system permease small subunit
MRTAMKFSTLANKVAKVVDKILGCVQLWLWFFIFVVTMSTGWLLWNNFIPEYYVFDPPPTYQTWVFCSNIIQLFLLPLLIIGNAIQSRKIERLLEKDFNLDKLSHDKNEEILALLTILSRKQ